MVPDENIHSLSSLKELSMKLSLLYSVFFTIAGVASEEFTLEATPLAQNAQCEKPAERREWRYLNRSERKAFIDAVKVRLFF
jgi:hypothetical protein